MNVRSTAFSLLTLICLALMVGLPAWADNIYDNGPVNGNNEAWTINFGFTVSDSFAVSGGNSTVNGLSFWAFMLPGDVAISVEVSLTSQEFGGTTYFDQVVNLSQANCFSTPFGFLACTETASFAGPSLDNGTYWLNLQNAVVNTGDPMYWNENSGAGCTSPGCPSQASESSLGTIPSEAFTLMGHVNGGSTPEPSSLLLFASGALGMAGMLRRKF